MDLRADRRPELNAVFFIFGESLVIFSAVTLLWIFEDAGNSFFAFTSIPSLNAIIFTLLCQLTLYLCGLYDPALKSGPIEQLIGLIQALAIAFGIMLFLLVLIGRSMDLGVILLGFGILIAFSKAWRLVIQKVSRFDYFRPKIILAGADGRIQEIGRGYFAQDKTAEKREPIYQFDILATADIKHLGRTGSTLSKTPHHTLQNSLQLADLAERYKTSKVVIGKKLAQALNPDEICALRHKGIQLCTEDAFTEAVSGRCEPSAIDLGSLIFSKSFQHTTRSGFKRLGDIVIACALLTALSPLFLFIMIRLKLKKQGRVFDTQTCLGFRKKTFIRYLFARPAQTPHAHLHNRIIRALPQLWNVLKGDMSLVGPYPLEPGQLEEVDLPYMDERFTVRPGLTGWAQTNCACNNSPGSIEHMLMYDLFYLKHISMLLDTIILLRALRCQTLPTPEPAEILWHTEPHPEPQPPEFDN